MNQTLLKPRQTIIIGYSGGPDSTYLLHALKAVQAELNLTLIAAHLDHQWRENSANDVEFCRNETEKLGVAFMFKKAAELDVAIKPNGSKEELGRKLRRAFFSQVAKEYNADAIALGHHADDQMETFFIRLMRGTTLSGLTGMKELEGSYIRPLLHLSKEEIIKYLEKHRIKFLIDPTNNSDAYLRNRIRLQVLPILQQTDDRFSSNLLRAMDHLQQAEDLLDTITQRELTQCLSDAGLDINKLISHPTYLVKRILLAWLITHKVPFTPSDGFLNEMIRFMKQQTTKKQHPLHEQWMLQKTGQCVQIKKATPSSLLPSQSY